ncbi:serine/threonine protein kinase [Streptomyces sp. ISL-43]|uniref:serine/threonine-protein kinase n=1 Tax=Streptomyces sp. ISL-43 TaxID=2819183 RepID=UPI001BE95070|nr:serine/threonine-protein kinase [Streptomyces sp. ISL-43]MBT2453189.1 serine/threonine protein kinase [Streptomyces sp. ISL-43]
MEQLHPRDPDQIGPYRLLARLGTGGMGQVFLGRSDRDGTASAGGIGTGIGTSGGDDDTITAAAHTAAVKLIHPHLAAHPGFRARFRREAAAARLVGGAWTAPVLDADPDAEIPWLATAYIAGPSLRQAVGRDFGPLPVGSLRVLAEGLSYALQDIHRAGLVHRDLKPGNILLTVDGPRVIDFGIARTLEATGDPALTQTGELLGSPGFLAPEQVHGTPVTPACDVFGLGAVLAYAATGRLPFGDPEQSGGIAALLLRVTEAEPELAGVPPELRDVVRDCLRKDPAARPTPAEVLARVAADGGSAPGPWLPEPLIARLGQHALSLLDREEAGPDRPATATRPLAATPAPHAGEAEASKAISGPHPRARSASTAFLLAVSAVVAVAAGGTVYTVMSGDGDDRRPSTADTPPATTQATATASVAPATLPEAYVGTWRATSSGQTWLLTLTPGAAGAPVMSLTVQAPGLACSWSAPLHSAAPGTVALDPSAVTSGAPPTCSPGGRSTLRLLPDGSLVRELENSPSAPLTYRRR